MSSCVCGRGKRESICSRKTSSDSLKMIFLWITWFICSAWCMCSIFIQWNFGWHLHCPLPICVRWVCRYLSSSDCDFVLLGAYRLRSYWYWQCNWLPAFSIHCESRTFSTLARDFVDRTVWAGWFLSCFHSYHMEYLSNGIPFHYWHFD